MTIRKCGPEQAFRQYINKMDTVNQKPCRNASERFSKKFTQIGHNLMTVALSVCLAAKDVIILAGVSLVTPVRLEILIVRILIPGAYQDWHEQLVRTPTPFHQVARIVVDILGVGAAAIGVATSLYKGSEWNVAMQKGLRHIPPQTIMKSPLPEVPTHIPAKIPSPLVFKPPAAIVPVPARLNIINPPVQVVPLQVILGALPAAPAMPPVVQQQLPAAPAMPPVVQQQLPAALAMPPVVPQQLPAPHPQPVAPVVLAPKPNVKKDPEPPVGPMPQTVSTARRLTAQLPFALPPPPLRVSEKLMPHKTDMSKLPPPPDLKHPGQHSRQKSIPPVLSHAKEPVVKPSAPPPPPPPPNKFKQPAAKGLALPKPGPAFQAQPLNGNSDQQSDTESAALEETNSLKPRRKISAHDLVNKRLRGILPPGATPRKHRISKLSAATGANILQARRRQIAPPSPQPSPGSPAASSSKPSEGIEVAQTASEPLKTEPVNPSPKRPKPMQLFADVKKGKKLRGTLAPGKTPRKARMETRSKEDAGGFLTRSKLLDKFPPGSPSSPKTPTFKKREKSSQKKMEGTPRQSMFLKLMNKSPAKPHTKSPAKPPTPGWTP